MDACKDARMDHRPLQCSRVLTHTFGVLAAVAIALSSMGVSAAPKGPPVWRDEFNPGDLDPAWYWVNENPDGWSLTEQTGFLRINSSPYPTGGENLLLRTGAEGNFTIATHVLFEPTANWQFAGLVIYQDESNYVQFGRSFCDLPELPEVCPFPGNGIYFDNVENNEWGRGNFATQMTEIDEAYLRLEVKGRKVTAFYSGDGQAWQKIGQHQLPPQFKIYGVGLTASQDYYSGQNPPAYFDYFSFTGNPKSSSPFVGHWEAVDVDASVLRLAIGGPPEGPFHITWTEDYISYCGGEAGIVRGTGLLGEGDPRVLEAQLHLQCFTTGASLDFPYTWRYDPVTDTLSAVDVSGMIITWYRPGRPAPAPDLYLRVNYGDDWVESFYEAGHVVRVTVTDADGNIKAAAQMYTQPREEWGGEPGFQTQPSDWDPVPPDIQPYDRVRAVLETGVTSEVQIGDIQGEINLDTDTVSGSIAIPGFSGSEEVQVQCMPWGAPEPPEDTYTSVVPDGTAEYTCAWPIGAWDIQPGQGVGVAYFTADGHWVANAFRVPQLVLYINYEDTPDVVEGDYELGHTVEVTVLGSEGQVKATASVGTFPMPNWGGAPGFRVQATDWIGGPPDIEIGDVVRAHVDNGLTTEVRIGEISATIDPVQNSVSGTVQAGWAGDIVDVVCMPWGGPEGAAIQTTTVAPDGTSKFTCQWDPTNWDIQLGESVGVAYIGSDHHFVSRGFEYWMGAFTAELPAGYWQEGNHNYHFDMGYSVPQPGSGKKSGSNIGFAVQSPPPEGGEPPLYGGYVLLRPEGLRAPLGGDCPLISSIRPEQATRFVWGWLTDFPMTRKEAEAHFMSIDVTAYWDEGGAGEGVRDLQLVELLRADQVDWPGYICSLANVPAMNLRVDYGHDWVESFYEAGHSVDLTVTESDAVTVRATATVHTAPKDLWGGESGFTTVEGGWAGEAPDLQPGNWVFAVVDNGVTAQVQIGDIQGTVDPNTDSVYGMIGIVGHSGGEEVTVECLPWGATTPAENEVAEVFPAGPGMYEYACSWAGEWDIQHYQDVGVAYTGPDGHWVANAFFAPRLVSQPPFYIEWGRTDPEEIILLSWKGSANLTNSWHHGACAGDSEYFGNSWVSEGEGTGGFFFASLVGWGTTGDWTSPAPNEATINSISSGCPYSADIPVHTEYRFSWGNLIEVQRVFGFGDEGYAHDVRPFIPRLTPADGYTQVLHPDDDGDTLLTENAGSCDFGCRIDDWNGSWFAIHNPETRQGMIVRHKPSDYSVALWVDQDGGSNTNSSSVLLLQPEGGFVGWVLETEYLCFYDANVPDGGWEPNLTLPDGC